MTITVSNNLPRVRDYARWLQGVDAMLRSSDPETKEKVREMKVELQEQLRAQLRGEVRTAVTPGSVHVSAFLADLSLMYANEEFVGDELIPDVRVEKIKDQYPIFSRRSQLAYPSDSGGGQRGRGNEVKLEFTTAEFECLPRMLETNLEQKTLDNQDGIFDWFRLYASNLLYGMAFNRELRKIGLVFTSANYGGNTSGILAASRWNSGSGGKPIEAIQTAKDNVWKGPEGAELIGVTTLPVYRVLSNHPVILDTLRIKDGIASLQDLARLFELDRIVVAKAWQDTANSGAAASISRMVSSKTFAIVAKSKAPKKESLSFGYNFLFLGERRMRQWMKEEEGTRGTWWMKSSCDEVPKVVAPEAGYALTTVID